MTRYYHLDMSHESYADDTALLESLHEGGEFSNRINLAGTESHAKCDSPNAPEALDSALGVYTRETVTQSDLYQNRHNWQIEE